MGKHEAEPEELGNTDGSEVVKLTREQEQEEADRNASKTPAPYIGGSEGDQP
jgi:hypothetical protein